MNTLLLNSKQTIDSKFFNIKLIYYATSCLLSTLNFIKQKTK